jgi:hypothetical protein
LTPKGLDRPATGTHTALTQLPIAAAHADRLYLASMLIIFGLGALVIAFVAIATLTEGRPGSAVAVWGAAIGGLACFCGAVVNIRVGIVLAGAVGPTRRPPRPRMSWYRIDTAFVSYALLTAYLAGLAIASVLTAVGLWHSQSVPRSLAVSFPIAMIIAGAASPGLTNLLLSMPLAAVMIMLAREIWRKGAPGSVTAVAEPAPISGQAP